MNSEFSRGPQSSPPEPIVVWWRENRMGEGAWRPIGRSGNTWLLDGAQQLVAKAMTSQHDQDEYVCMFREIGDAGIGPQLVAVIEDSDAWYAVCRYVTGCHPTAFDSPTTELVWAQIPLLLDALSRCTKVPRFDVLNHWISVLDRLRFSDPSAQQLCRDLLRTVPSGTCVLTHGDFAPQNLILAGDRLMLIDWEQAGGAPIGFDAGWLLALSAAGVVSGGHPAVFATKLANGGDIPAQTLRWFVRLGLVRLLWRVNTLEIVEPVRTLIRARLMLVISREVGDT